VIEDEIVSARETKFREEAISLDNSRLVLFLKLEVSGEIQYLCGFSTILSSQPRLRLNRYKRGELVLTISSFTSVKLAYGVTTVPKFEL
jgi:hypothetical protein